MDWNLFTSMISTLDLAPPHRLALACQNEFLVMLPKEFLTRFVVFIIAESLFEESEIRSWINRKGLQENDIRVISQDSLSKFPPVSFDIDLAVVSSECECIEHYLSLVLENRPENNRTRIVLMRTDCPLIGSEMFKSASWERFSSEWVVAKIWFEGTGPSHIVEETTLEFASEFVPDGEEDLNA